MILRYLGGLLLLSLAGFFGCASQNVMLIHPQSGSTIRCGAAGVGLLAGGVPGYVGDCLKNYEGQGYVQMDKLTPAERAELERRGLLPKEEQPAPRAGYY